MGRSLGDMSSAANAAKNVTGFEGILKPAVERPAFIDPNKPKRTAKPKKEATGGVKYTKKSEEGDMQVTAEETIDESQAGRGSFKPTMPKGPRGSAPGPDAPKTKEVSVPFHNMHQQYSNLINSARSVKDLSPEHHDAIDIAAGHLMHSAVSHRLAEVDGNLHKWNQNNDAAHGHLADAVEHLTYAHDTLRASGVHSVLASKNMISTMPSHSDVADLAAKAASLPRTGAGGIAGARKSYKRGVLGRSATINYHPQDGYKISKADGTSVTFGDKDLNEIGRAFGRNHPGFKKLIAMKGTPRDQNLRVSREERRQGVVKARGIGVAEDAPPGMNPKKRGSGKRVDTTFRTDANPSNNTGGRPKF